MTNRQKCPACGNADPRLIEDNGEEQTSPDLTLLCVAPGEDCNTGAPGVCGCQWNPNDADQYPDALLPWALRSAVR